MAGAVTNLAGAAEVGRVLGAAFVDDPLSLWTLGARGDREGRLTRTFRAFASGAVRTEGSVVLLDEQRRAAGVWLPPGKWRAPVSEVVRSLPSVSRAYGTALPRALGLFFRIEKHHPKEPHWYLQAVGTVPQFRGQGVGAALLAPVLERCDTDRLPAYLESSNPRNLPFYERHGFRAMPLFPLPAGCPVVTPMWRDPR